MPESLKPGRFDFFGCSHQIFHILVVLATAVHLVGILSAFDNAQRIGGAVVVLIGCYIFTGFPTGLGATLVVSMLILRRAGSWWRLEPASKLVAAGA